MNGSEQHFYNDYVRRIQEDDDWRDEQDAWADDEEIIHLDDEAEEEAEEEEEGTQSSGTIHVERIEEDGPMVLLGAPLRQARREQLGRTIAILQSATYSVSDRWQALRQLVDAAQNPMMMGLFADADIQADVTDILRRYADDVAVTAMLQPVRARLGFVAQD